jgi:hypothetical protein
VNGSFTEQNHISSSFGGEWLNNEFLVLFAIKHSLGHPKFGYLRSWHNARTFITCIVIGQNDIASQQRGSNAPMMTSNDTPNVDFLLHQKCTQLSRCAMESLLIPSCFVPKSTASGPSDIPCQECHKSALGQAVDAPGWIERLMTRWYPTQDTSPSPCGWGHGHRMLCL